LNVQNVPQPRSMVGWFPSPSSARSRSRSLPDADPDHDQLGRGYAGDDRPYGAAHQGAPQSARRAKALPCEAVRWRASARPVYARLDDETVEQRPGPARLQCCADKRVARQARAGKYRAGKNQLM